jgi:phage-related holin
MSGIPTYGLPIQAQSKEQYVPFSVSRELKSMKYHSGSLIAGWQVKSVIATLGTIATELLADVANTANRVAVFMSIDLLMVELLCSLYVIDVFLGIVYAVFQPIIQRQPTRFDFAIFKRGMCKVPIYALYLIIAGTVGVISERLGLFTAHVVVDWLIGYLTLTEAISCIKNLRRLGVNVPPLLELVTLGVSKKIEELAGKFMDGK